MDILAQVVAIVEREQALFTAQERMEAAARLRRYAEELEMAAMMNVDYELIGDPRD